MCDKHNVIPFVDENGDYRCELCGNKAIEEEGLGCDGALGYGCDFTECTCYLDEEAEENV